VVRARTPTVHLKLTSSKKTKTLLRSIWVERVGWATVAHRLLMASRADLSHSRDSLEVHNVTSVVITRLYITPSNTHETKLINDADVTVNRMEYAAARLLEPTSSASLTFSVKKRAVCEGNMADVATRTDSDNERESTASADSMMSRASTIDADDECVTSPHFGSACCTQAYKWPSAAERAVKREERRVWSEQVVAMLEAAAGL
jgi:hypothetical protein